MEKHIFILGARGFMQNYGGWETFINNLLLNWKDDTFKFYVFEKVDNPNETEITVKNGVTCIPVYIGKQGNVSMVLFDIKSMFAVRKYIQNQNLGNAAVYSLGSRAGIFYYFYRPILKNAGIVLLENPAGLEWKRDKWNWLVKKYCKISAYAQAKASDYLVCDSEGIRDYYLQNLKGKLPNKLYISYGTYEAEPLEKNMPDKVTSYFNDKGIVPGDYYLILGRFVPENNYEMMIKGFMKSSTKKRLIIICNVEKNKFYDSLRENTNFDKDERIKIVGAMYDKEILNYVRQCACAYIHGHSVGGTNPGLLEAMSATEVNLLNDVVFNKEVGGEAALYFSNEDSLSELINSCDSISEEQRSDLGMKSKRRMKDLYSWDHIVGQYEKLFDEILD